MSFFGRMRVAAVTTIHASAVALNGRGIVIVGPSGSGKSTLALDLMAVGAMLIADDRVELSASEGGLIVSCPAPLAGLIEARGVGILNATPAGPTPVVVVVDLGQTEPERLPPKRHTSLAGVTVPLVLGGDRLHLCSSLRQLVIGGRSV